MTINIAHIINIKEHANFSSLITPPPPKKKTGFQQNGYYVYFTVDWCQFSALYLVPVKKTSESDTCIILSPFFKDILILSWDRYLILIS